MHAIISGVRPLWSVASTGTPAPAPSRTSTTATCPFLLAQCIGLGPWPLSECRSIRALFSTMNLATATCPLSAIQCAAEWPYSSRSSKIPAPYRSYRYSTCARDPERMASKSVSLALSTSELAMEKEVSAAPPPPL